MKNEIIRAVIFIAIPMGLVQIFFRIIDNKFRITKYFFDKHPLLIKKRNLFRIIATLSVVLLISVIYYTLSQFTDFPIKIFYVTVGALAGLINGISISLTYANK